MRHLQQMRICWSAVTRGTWGMDGPCVNATILVMKCSPRPGFGAVAVDRDDGVARSLAMT